MSYNSCKSAFIADVLDMLCHFRAAARQLALSASHSPTALISSSSL
jgi:hypothetical protein